jgi:anti-sigma factor RsiW
MVPDQKRLTPAERADLVAYLDGELDEAQSRAIATKLTHSLTARREIEALEKTWELLEYLPRAQAPEDFTSRTLTEVHQWELRGERLESAVQHAAQRLIKGGVWVLGALLALGLGYAATRWAWPDPTSRLGRDLSIAEHLDEYRDVGTMQFLDRLADSPEFGTDPY